MHKNALICMLLTLAGSACASSQAEQVRDARAEQTDARTVAQTQATEDREHARNAAIDHKHEVAQENLAASDRHDQASAKELLDVSKDRATYESRARARIETIDVRISAAREKLDALGASAPTSLQAELVAVKKQADVLRQDVRDLPATSAANWETTVEKLDDRLSELNSRVKKLTSTIEDQHV